MTRELKAAAKALDIAICDHLVIGRKGQAAYIKGRIGCYRADRPSHLSISHLKSRLRIGRSHELVRLRPSDQIIRGAPARAGRRRCRGPGQSPITSPRRDTTRPRRKRDLGLRKLNLVAFARFSKVLAPRQDQAGVDRDRTRGYTCGISTSAFCSQNGMSSSRYIVAAAVRCSEARLRTLVLLVELAEAEVAVGDERAHPELVGERQRGTVMAASLLRGIAAGGDLAKEAEGRRFVSALAALAGKRQGSPDKCESVLEPVSQEICLPQIHQAERQQHGSRPRSLVDAQRLLQQGDALGHPTRERVTIASSRRSSQSTHRSSTSISGRWRSTSWSISGPATCSRGC